MNQQVPFHEQLIRERKRRGWSQEAIAKQLGIDPKTVGRWERGENLPTLKLQEELCRLFGKSAEEFGLLPPDSSVVDHVDVQQLTTEQQTNRSIGSSPSLSGRRLFPSLLRAMQGQTNSPSQPQNSNIEAHIQTILRNNAVVDHMQLFGVDTFLEKVKNDLFAAQAGWIISLFGEGGLGKTALAYEVVARYAVAAGFTRVGWVSAKTLQLLPDGELLRYGSAELHWIYLIKKLADQLEIQLGDNSSGWISDFQQGMHALPAKERCLLIIDNLETVDDVNEAIHYLGGSHITKPHKIIVTTRYALRGKLPYLVERDVRGIELQPALHFIRSIGNDDIIQASDDELQPIVAITEGNPLLIKLFVNRFLTSHLPLPLVLMELQEINKRLGKNIIDYLYSESLTVLEHQCGDVAHGIMNAFCPLSAGESIPFKTLHQYSGIEDEQTFRNTLAVACNLALIRTSKLNSHYSIHSLLWKFVCAN